MNPINPQNNQPVNSNPPSSLSLQTSSWESQDLKNEFYRELFAAINADPDPIEFTPHSISPAESLNLSKVEQGSVEGVAVAIELGVKLEESLEVNPGGMLAAPVAIDQVLFTVDVLQNIFKGSLMSRLEILIKTKIKQFNAETDLEKKTVLTSDINELTEIKTRGKKEVKASVLQEIGNALTMTPKTTLVIGQLMNCAKVNESLVPLVLGLNVLSSFWQLKGDNKNLRDYLKNIKLYSPENQAPPEDCIKQLEAAHKQNLKKNNLKLKELIDKITLAARDDSLTTEILKNPEYAGIPSVEAGKTQFLQDINTYIDKKNTDEGEKIFDKLNEQMVLSQETHAILLKNAVKNFMGCKTNIDKNFLNIKVIKSKINLAVNSLLATKSLVLIVAIKVGVAIAAGAALGLAFTGYGLLGVLVGGLIGGLIYFYCQKPNLFKVYCKGVPLQIFIKNIGLMISSFELAKHRLKIQTTEAKVNLISLSLLDQDFKRQEDLYAPLLPSNPLEAKLQGLQAKLQVLEGIVKDKTEKIDELKAKKFAAGYEDFKSRIGIASVKGKKDIEDPCEVMADYLLNPEQNDVCNSLMKLAKIDSTDDTKRAAYKLKKMFGTEVEEILKSMMALQK